MNRILIEIFYIINYLNKILKWTIINLNNKIMKLYNKYKKLIQMLLNHKMMKLYNNFKKLIQMLLNQCLVTLHVILKVIWVFKLQILLQYNNKLIKLMN